MPQTEEHSDSFSELSNSSNYELVRKESSRDKKPDESREARDGRDGRVLKEYMTERHQMKWYLMEKQIHKYQTEFNTCNRSMLLGELFNRVRDMYTFLAGEVMP